MSTSIYYFLSLPIGIWMPYFIGNKLNCYCGTLLLRNWIIHCENYSTILIIGFQHKMSNKPVNKNRHYVLENSLTWLWVHLIWDQWFENTQCVSYFTELVSGSFGNGTVNKNRRYVLDILMCLFRDHYVTNHWIKTDTMC